jgi:predicted dienelactone hydrolase
MPVTVGAREALRRRILLTTGVDSAETTMEDTTFFAFTPSNACAEAVPVFLFQSGYGSNSSGHQPLLQKIADAGYVVVVPDRDGDCKGGKECIPKVY